MGVLAGGRHPHRARPLVVRVGNLVSGILDGVGPEAGVAEHHYIVGRVNRALANVLQGGTQGAEKLLELLGAMSLWASWTQCQYWVCRRGERGASAGVSQVLSMAMSGPVWGLARFAWRRFRQKFAPWGIGNLALSCRASGVSATEKRNLGNSREPAGSRECHWRGEGPGLHGDPWGGPWGSAVILEGPEHCTCPLRASEPRTPAPRNPKGW